MGLAAANCSGDNFRLGDIFGSSSAQKETTGSVPPAQGSPAGRVESRPLPDGTSGGGRGLGNYRPPGAADVTGSLPPAAPPPPPPKWSWEGGTPVTVAPGETIETIARRHNVPVAVILQANRIASPSAVRPGQRLVIPRYAAGAALPPPTRVAANTPLVPGGAPHTAKGGVHIVAPGETLHSISRLYGKPVTVLAKANNMPPTALLKVGERLVIPGVQVAAAPSAPPAAHAAPPPPAAPKLATVESPHSARLASPAPAAPASPVKVAEPAGGMPSFRWPVRGRVIAGFGPKPNGLQNDGINLAVPEGTLIKAAEDGVIAYAGNELKGYGNLVLVRHSNGFVTAYAHASEILVKRGEQVKRGQVIARSGQTGNVNAPQLHFEIRKGANPVDPTQYLNGA
jgi:murein DD-endopeptidase MepM/ murein hydrolase activator NlpD